MRKIEEIKNKTDIELENRKRAYEFAIKFAQMQRQNLVDLSKNASSSVTYTRYTKEQILTYMQSPKSNEKNIRNASIYMYDASSQYRRLILYYAQMHLWAHTISPLGFDPTKMKEDAFRKAYLKAAHQVETMNLKHEMQKASIIALREGVIYGVIWRGTNSFFVQRINPDICKLSSVIDGTWNYAVDFSQIKESDLFLYPPEFTTLRNTYLSTGIKWQEIPESISFCLKADETTSQYSIPPWASTLPMLYDIETFKALQETKETISNYKAIGLQIPLNDDGTPKFDWNLATEYYQMMVAALPPYIGAFMAPMKAESFNFEKSGNLNGVDTVSMSEEQFWKEGGTSPLLFGSSSNNTAGALKLSVTADENIILGLGIQCERLVNRILKSLSGTQKFKLSILPVTTFNKADWISYYKEASSMGIPVKSSWAAVLGLTPIDIIGMDFVEMNMLNMGNLTPLSSSYTQSSSGRPQSNEEDLSESGEQTRGDDSNANR